MLEEKKEESEQEPNEEHRVMSGSRLHIRLYYYYEMSPTSNQQTQLFDHAFYKLISKLSS